MHRLLATALLLFMASASFADGLAVGSRYKIIKPVFVMGVYEDLNDRRLTKARAYLHPIRLAERAYTAFHSEVPAGTVLTIYGLKAAAWYAPWTSRKYAVSLSPDVARGLEVVLTLDRGFERADGGLNPAFFEEVK